MQTTHICVNCSNTFTGKFCNICGEKVISDKDKTVLKFAEQSVDMFTHLDSKFLKSFTSIFLKPGLLTAEFIKGVRVKYAKPVQLFIVINALYFLVNHFTVNFSDFRTPLYDHLSVQNTLNVQTGLTSHMKELVNEKIAEENLMHPEKPITMKEYAEKFDANAETLSKTMIFMMIPVFALGLYLISFRKMKYFVDALVFSTHFYCFFLLYLTALCLLVWGGLHTVGEDAVVSFFNVVKRYFVLISLLLQGYYFWYALKRVIPEAKWKRALRVLFLYTLSIINFIFIYRVILFYITYYTT